VVVAFEVVVVEVGGLVVVVALVVEEVLDMVDVVETGGGGADPTGHDEARTAVIQALPTSGY
jgi:hypothetical protein